MRLMMGEMNDFRQFLLLRAFMLFTPIVFLNFIRILSFSLYKGSLGN